MDESIASPALTISQISAITSSGWSFNATVVGNINIKLFANYLKEIMNFLSEQHRVKKEKTLIIMDNSSSHRAKTVKGFLDSYGAHVFFPSYSPELGPVKKYF